MSSIVKNDRVIVNSENRVFLRVQDQALFHAERQQNQESCSEMIKRANQEAKNIISDAQEKAKKIMLESEEERGKIEEIAKKEGYASGYSEGYDQGFQQGLEEGQTQGRKEYKDLVQNAEELKQQYLKDYQNLYRISEENMLKLAIDIAKNVIGSTLENNDKAYMELAYKALNLVKGQKEVELRLSGEDYQDVIGNKDLLISRLEGIDDIHIIEDTFLDRGSCIIDAGNGVIDGGVKTQMDQIESILTNMPFSPPEGQEDPN